MADTLGPASPYRKEITYHFEAGRESFAITDIGPTHLSVEETRKNGQEDCHFYGCLELVSIYDEPFATKWRLDEQSREQLETYWDASVDDALEAYINKHGVPG